MEKEAVELKLQKEAIEIFRSNIQVLHPEIGPMYQRYGKSMMALDTNGVAYDLLLRFDIDEILKVLDIEITLEDVFTKTQLDKHTIQASEGFAIEKHFIENVHIPEWIAFAESEI